MALATRIYANNTRANQRRQALAELRLEEIIKVAGIAEDYDAIDRRGDLAVETAFARCYQLVDGDDERAAIADAFAVWQRSEAAEERHVRGSVDDSVVVLKANNPVWLNGAAVPSDSDPVA